MDDAPQRAPRDIRMEGFAQRAPVSESTEWIDRYARIQEAESVTLDAAVGRILAESFVTPADGPPTDIAVRDGYALRSCETVGAGSYNPLPFCLQDHQPALRPYSEVCPIANALGRVLSRNVISPVDVPGFDRSRMDGFAVRSIDTTGATDDSPRTLQLNAKILTPGVVPTMDVAGFSVRALNVGSNGGLTAAKGANATSREFT